MVFRDQKLVCEECGNTFFFTVTEQRRLAERVGEENVVAPHLCPAHRGESGSQPHDTPERVPDRQERAPERAVQAPVSAAPAEEFPLEEEGIEVKLIGEVKWFNRNKGYGFITKADGNDVFFHRSDVVGRQSLEIEENQRVEFQIRRTDKGLEAFNVSILPEP
jgi:cold shock CspA family protein